jgi:desulfoferrodoxin (superoxide reductase-like protein)
MGREIAARCDLARRGFLGWAAASAGLLALPGRTAPSERRLAGDPARLTAFERQHLPVLALPAHTAQGSKVPVAVEMTHPMEPGHYIRRIEVANPRDPVASKGVFHLTPGSGRVYLAWQLRLGEGRSEVSVTAECNRHGTWSSSRTVEVAPGGGGCMASPQALRRTGGAEVNGPVLRIPALIERGHILPGEIVRAQVKMRHPSRTGLVVRDDEIVREEPFFLEELEVRYCGQRVARFALTPALSDDPFITFAFRATRDGPLLVRLVNNRGREFEATRAIRLG